MFSLVIAEDEKIARERLIHMVKWGDLGFRVDASFSDGQEVLDYLRYNTPNVILTDIKMPGASGLDIAKYVAEQHLPVQIVLLSGYEEFEFAKRALAYHVEDYLTKPLALAKLKEVFQRICAQLEKQSEQALRSQERHQHYNKLINYEKQQFLADIYYGAITNPNQIRSRLELLSSTSRKKDCYLLKLSLSDCEPFQNFVKNYGLDEFQRQLIQLTESLYSNFDLYPIDWDSTPQKKGLDLLGVLWQKDDADRINPGSVPNKQELIATVEKYLSIPTYISTFHKLKSPEDLSNYHERITKNESCDTLVQNMEYLQLLRGENLLLSSYLKDNDREKGMVLGNTLVQNLLRGGITFAQRQCMYTITKLIDSIAPHDLHSWNNLYWQYASPDIFTIMQPEAISRWFNERLASLFDIEEVQRSKKPTTSLDKVMTYIREHFSEDISLNTVADAVYLHPSYISRLIKEQTGKNFSTLITEMRIERAVSLLESTDLRVYEVAEKVGFNNLKYFYKVFKSTTGKSPRDYRPAGSEQPRVKNINGTSE
jgi:two-component system response regulator YesN